MIKTISLLIALFTVTFISAQSVKKSRPTNFVIIIMDDMGYGDLGITGALQYTTPNMDKMAKNGMFFTHYYSPQAVCGASRAGLLTGCYPNRIGVSGAPGPIIQRRDI